MSQYQQPPDYQDQYAGMGDVPTRTSGLAMGALICTLIFCCPVTTLLGVLLGLIALVTIGRDPTKKGKGLALIAIVLGIVFTVGQGWGGWWFYKTFYVPVLEGPSDALAAGFNGDLQAMRDEMHMPQTSPTDAEMTAFVEELRSRYGALVDVQLNQRTAGQRQPQPGQTEAVFPYVFTFEKATLDGEALMVFADQATDEVVMKPAWFTIFDPDKGDLTFPPGADTSGGTGAGGTDGEADSAPEETETDTEDAGG